MLTLRPTSVLAVLLRAVGLRAGSLHPRVDAVLVASCSKEIRELGDQEVRKSGDQESTRKYKWKISISGIQEVGSEHSQVRLNENVGKGLLMEGEEHCWDERCNEGGSGGKAVSSEFSDHFGRASPAAAFPRYTPSWQVPRRLCKGQGSLKDL